MSIKLSRLIINQNEKSKQEYALLQLKWMHFDFLNQVFSIWKMVPFHSGSISGQFYSKLKLLMPVQSVFFIFSFVGSRNQRLQHFQTGNRCITLLNSCTWMKRNGIYLSCVHWMHALYSSSECGITCQSILAVFSNSFPNQLVLYFYCFETQKKKKKTTSLEEEKKVLLNAYFSCQTFSSTTFAVSKMYTIK